MRLTNDRQQYCAALCGCAQSKTLTNWRVFFKLGVAKQIWIGRRTLLPAASSSLSDLPLAGLTAGEKEESST
jgi:hypothetical protein